MPCPYFYPETKCERLLWPHSSRLPLGVGWEGRCHAPGHAGEQPAEDDLRTQCNLGYAAGCSRLPKEPQADAVRFGVFKQQAGAVIQVHFVRERRHLPLDHGTLEFDAANDVWLVRHPNEVLQRQAECFLAGWREKNSGTVAVTKT